MSVWLRNLGPCNRAAKGQDQGSEDTQGQGTLCLKLSGPRSDDDSARCPETPRAARLPAPGSSTPASALSALSGDRGRVIDQCSQSSQGIQQRNSPGTTQHRLTKLT